MKTFNEQWGEIGESFDWEKVHKTMKHLNWTWWNTEGVPSIFQIIEKARGLCEDAYISGYSATGGFQASYDKETNRLKLEFVVSNWEARED